MALPHYAQPTISSSLKRVSPTPLPLPRKKSRLGGTLAIEADGTVIVHDILASMKRSKCTTCDRSLPTAQYPKLPEGGSCTHDNETCKRCWHQWLQAQVASKTFDQISCAQCSNVLGQGEIRALATRRVYESYLDAEFKATMSANPDFRWCISPTCKSGQIHSEGNIFRCVACHSRACVHCNVAWHGSETCAAYQARVQAQPQEEEESAKELEKVAKLCPSCGIRTQKNGGCDHMTCSQCRYQYCWVCLADYKEIHRVGNSAHNATCQHWRHNPSTPLGPANPPTVHRRAELFYPIVPTTDTPTPDTNRIRVHRPVTSHPSLRGPAGPPS